MTQTFADSFYLLALFNPADAAHERALAVAEDLKGTLVTSDWILTEVADALSDPKNRTRCVEFIEDLRNSSSVEVVPASRERFDTGWELYRTRPDKDWSLTDCVSFIVMKERRITEALTGDHHFEQAGFTALLK